MIYALPLVCDGNKVKSWVVFECEILQMSDHYTEQGGADYHAVHWLSWVSELATYSVTIEMKAFELVIAFGAVLFVILYTALSTAFHRIVYTLSHILSSLEVWPNSFLTVVFPSLKRFYVAFLSIYMQGWTNFNVDPLIFWQYMCGAKPGKVEIIGLLRRMYLCV